jgi:hypothetical protein
VQCNFGAAAAAVVIVAAAAAAAPAAVQLLVKNREQLYCSSYVHIDLLLLGGAQ